MSKKFISGLLILGLFACRTEKTVVTTKQSNWAQAVHAGKLQNLYKVDADLFRSEQPDASDMRQLAELNIKTILSVRNIKKDKQKAKGTALIVEQVSINTWTISYEEVVRTLKIIERSPKPILIHCKHGSDRTGCIVAAYRMAYNGWTKEEAIKEFKEGGFGYHEKYFPNILKLLQAIDIEQLKKDIAAHQ